MAKKAYVGVDNVARKIKRGYVGVHTAVPIYQTQTTTETVTINSDALLSKYFTVSNGSYGFVWNSSYNQFRSSNSGIHGSTATTTLTALQDCTVTYTYNYETEPNYDKFSLTVKGTGIHTNVSGVGTATTRTDTLTQGQTIVFSYTKDSSGNNNGDYVSFYNMSAVVTTTKEVQVGTDYRNVARKIKKAYIGIGGVARPCFTIEGLSYFGQIDDLTYGGALDDSAATTVGNYALFALSESYYHSVNEEYVTTVDSYNASLTKVNCPAFSHSRRDFAATTVGNYAIFCGGYDSNNDWYSAAAEIYDTSLVHTNRYDFYDASHLAATTVGNYALFAGGYDEEDYIDYVFAVDSALTTRACTGLDSRRYDLAATTVGNYALFAGGLTSDDTYFYCYSTVDAYDSSLTKIYEEDVEVWVEDELEMEGGYWDYTTIPQSLSESRGDLAATTVGDYAIFAGGLNSQIYNSLASSAVDIFSTSLTRIMTETLSEGRRSLAATTVGNYALFAGGKAYNMGVGSAVPDIGDNNGRDGTTTVDVIDTSLTFSVAPNLSVGRYNLLAATVGNYALFAGGYYAIYEKVNGNSYTCIENGDIATVDVYTI